MLKAQTTGYIYQEKRNSIREQVALDAKGIIPNADTVIDCTILDISETGALMELDAVDIIPKNFKLFVPERHMLSECRVVRRSGRFVGIEFQTCADLRPNDEEPVAE